MAKFNYDDYVKMVGQGGENKSNSNKNSIEFFNLKDDGDIAYVRFPYTSFKDIEIVTVHSVELVSKNNKKYKKGVSCLRTSPAEPASVCPLCASGSEVRASMLLKFVEYVDVNGVLTPTAKVWERSLGKFTDDLKAQFLMLEPDAVSNYVFKITRNGARGDKATRYSVVAGMPHLYKDSVYVKDFSSLDNYKFSNHLYLVKSAPEMTTYLQTGDFPWASSSKPAAPSTTTTPTPVAPVTVPEPAPAASSGPALDITGVTPTATNPTPTPNPVDPTAGRPQRYTF